MPRLQIQKLHQYKPDERAHAFVLTEHFFGQYHALVSIASCENGTWCARAGTW